MLLLKEQGGVPDQGRNSGAIAWLLWNSWHSFALPLFLEWRTKQPALISTSSQRGILHLSMFKKWAPFHTHIQFVLQKHWCHVSLWTPQPTLFISHCEDNYLELRIFFFNRYLYLPKSVIRAGWQNQKEVQRYCVCCVREQTVIKKWNQTFLQNSSKNYYFPIILVDFLPGEGSFKMT